MKKILTSLCTAAALTAAGTAFGAVITSNPLTFTTSMEQAATFNLGSSYDGDMLVDFTLRYDGVLNNNTYAGLYFGDHTGASLGLKANCGTGSCTGDVYSRLHGWGGAFIGGSDLQAGKTYHIVGHLHKTANSATYNQIDVWLFDHKHSVDLNSLGAAHASFTDAAPVTLESFSTIGLRTFNVAGSSITIDNINLAEVPEPGSLALIGLALAGLGVAARRKRG